MKIKPNTFMMGAQKAATTSLYNWLSQHPEVCGPNSIKDYPLFLDKWNIFDEESKMFDNEYLDAGYDNEKIVLHGCVQYMFEEIAIERIAEFSPQAKLICILRNPVDRALSAYKYFKKLNIETRPLKVALETDEKFLKGTTQQRNDFTYISHGLYYQQLLNIYKRFPEQQVKIVLYDDLINDSRKIIGNIFEFLEIDKSFMPDFKEFNVTGEVKFKILQKLVFNDSKVKRFIVENFVDFFIPIHKRSKMRWAFNDWNTRKKQKTNKEGDIKERQQLKSYFIEDIYKLEKLMHRNLDCWK
ncbi:MAG TPA: sulfotransferase [Mangrovimonas sp.]|nr:sulfotransferase [Mangrovimonas sp.]